MVTAKLLQAEVSWKIETSWHGTESMSHSKTINHNHVNSTIWDNCRDLINKTVSGNNKIINKINLYLIVISKLPEWMDTVIAFMLKSTRNNLHIAREVLILHLLAKCSYISV